MNDPPLKLRHVPFVMIELIFQVHIDVCSTYLGHHNQLPAVRVCLWYLDTAPPLP